MKDILDRIADSSANESSHELICRLRDCAHEIEALRSALASRPDAQDDERGAFEAWARTADMPLGMYSATDYADGATQISWDAWQARAAAPSPDREQVGEAIPGSPAFALRGLYKLATEYFIDGKPATPDEYIAWQRGIIEALTSAKIPDPKYYGTQDEDGYRHEAKCAYVDGWNECRASILAKDASPSRECGERQVAALSDEQARTVECADSWLRMRGLQTYTDLRDTLFAVLRAIGYTEEFAEAHPDLKVSEGVKLFLAASAPTLGDEELPSDRDAP